MSHVIWRQATVISAIRYEISRIRLLQIQNPRRANNAIIRSIDFEEYLDKNASDPKRLSLEKKWKLLM